MTKAQTGNRISVALLATLLGAHAYGQRGESYPTKAVRLIVPFATGGGTDMIARSLAQKLSEAFGQSVVVDNRAGGGGTIGHETVVRAAPDGYTMALTSASYATNPALFKLPYDPVKDITAISLIGESGWMISLHPSVPAKSTAELIALAKAKPGALNYASTGTGGVTHLVTELFNLMAGTQMAHIPYKGTGAALNDLLGGQVQLIFGGIAPLVQFHKAGRIRGLAVTTIKRNIALPDVPTIAETLTGYEAILWYGCFGPKNLPKNIASLWNTEIEKALSTAAMQERLASEGLDVVGGPPGRFHQVVSRDVPKWISVVNAAKIKTIQ